MTKKKQLHAPPPTVEQSQELPKEGDLLREIAVNRQKIKQLNTARNRIDTAIRSIRTRITESETAVYQPYEPTEPTPTEETFRQLELF